MSDTYIEVGPMDCSKDATKVATKYVPKAPKVMREAATKAIRAATGFTPDKGTNKKGFRLDVTLLEVVLGTFKGQPSVTCRVNGVVATFPVEKFLTKTLTGSATVAGGTSDRDVEDCISAVMTDLTSNRVIPLLRTQPKP